MNTNEHGSVFIGGSTHALGIFGTFLLEVRL